MLATVALLCASQAAPMAADWPFETQTATPLGGKYQFTEGPTWVPSKAGGNFVFCDMSGDKVYIWSSRIDDEPMQILSPSGRAVGSATGRDGTVYQVLTGSRAIGKWTLGEDKKPTAQAIFAKDWGGKKLGGMNDLAVHPGGAVYVTHAEWFIDPLTKEVDHSGVIRISTDGTVSDAANSIARPNGICFTQDGRTAYVTEFSSAKILKFTVRRNGSFEERAEFADLAAMAKSQKIEGRGGADGIRTDQSGNVYSTGPAGIWVLNAKGEFIAHLPTRATNLAFGGTDGKTILITTGGGVSTIRAKRPGF